MFKEQFTRTNEEEKFKEGQVLVWDSLDGEPDTKIDVLNLLDTVQ